MVALLKILFSIVMVAIVETAMAKNITVGAPGGSWDLNTDFKTWASSQTFTKGDILIFSYDASNHDVLELSKGDYDSCTTSKPIQTYKTGNDAIPLSSTGNRYFACGTLGHCGGGMKVEIDTVDASNPSPSTPGTPGATPNTPGTTPSSPSPPPPRGSSGADGLRAKAVVGLGMLMVFAL